MLSFLAGTNVLTFAADILFLVLSGFQNWRTADLLWESTRVSEERAGVLFLEVRAKHPNRLEPGKWTCYFRSQKKPNLHEFVVLWFRENLSKDLYLMSQMDSDQFVPIWTIASMEGIKVLTTDMDLILDVLRCKWKV